jgi:hypothetical protein
MAPIVCWFGLLTASLPKSVSLTLALATAVPAPYAPQIMLATHKIEMPVIMISPLE